MRRITRRILSAILLVVVFVYICWLVSNSSDKSGYTVPTTPKHDLLCVVVPYRDRWKELEQFAPHMDAFLRRQDVEHLFLIINQTDSNRFNRASLINIGWYEADRLHCNYMVMHDVDLLPLNPSLNYTFPGEGVVRHIASPEYHPKQRYNYTKFIGGILLLTMDDFKKVNGMSNKYWGWGLEDDEFYLRLRDGNLLSQLQRPTNLSTGREKTFLHNHDDHERKRDQKYIYNQKNMTHRRDRLTGLENVQYKITRRKIMEINNVDVTVVDVELFCNRTFTPYCTFPNRKF
uniref:Beta-1,4-galactosyltransferase 7 n=1 Tax=Panagrolaimus sp. JU765 TaxID=591449 RepID=A0AC34QH89_9BILA